ncbi:MAG: hypothetical protein NWP98_00825 [Erythrobacter sp.]|nr:hypothetical protein [Erythrobacter sp.]
MSISIRLKADISFSSWNDGRGQRSATAASKIPKLGMAISVWVHYVLANSDYVLDNETDLFSVRSAERQPIVLTVLGMVAVVFFTILDQGLSGGSAQDPSYAMALLAAGVLGTVLLATNSFGRAGRIIGVLLGLSPFLFVAGIVLVGMGSRSLELNRVQQNAECAVEAAGIPEQDVEYVRRSLRQMKQYSFAVTSIEDRLDITILPGCRFERGAPARAWQRQPKPEKPEIQIEDYQPPARNDTLPLP